MTTAEFEVTNWPGGKLAVRTPFNFECVAASKALGGQWKQPYWMFDLRNEVAVRDMLTRIFGHDGDGPAETVVAEIALDEFPDLHNHKIVFAGLTIAQRPARDTAVRVGLGAIVKEGEFDESGGSVKNPRLCPQPGTVLLVRDVPAGHPDLKLPGVTVLATSVDVAALSAERARLVARIAEIDALTGGIDQ